jgi:hypothetical protein
MNGESRPANVTLPGKQERGDFLGVSVEVDEDGLVGGEE